MALTPQEIQALDAHFGYSPQPSVASSPVGLVKKYESDLSVDAAGQKAKAETLAKGEAEKQLNADKEKSALQQQLMDIERAARAIREAKGMVGGDNFWEAGYMGNKLKDTSGTDAYALNKQLDQIKSSVALDKLMAMKQNSPTGASGFGALSAPELNLLTSNQGSLEQGQGEHRLSSKLSDVYSNYNNIYKQLSGGKELPPYDARDPSKPIHYSEYFK